MRWLAAIVCVVWLAPAVASAQSKKQEALEHFEQAEAYMKTKAYESAIQEYEAAYALVPKAGFLFNIGLAYEAWGKADKALEYYESYLKKEPKGRAATEARARAEALRNAVAEARARDAKRAEAARRATEGEAAMSSGDHEAAKAAFSDAYALSSDPEYVFELAEAHRARGDRAQAIVEYERYRSLAAGGERSALALERASTLKRELARDVEDPDGNGGKQPPDRDLIGPNDKPEPVEPRAKDGGGLRWGWVAVGAGLIAGGIAADVLPESGDNGEWDATDFLPLGLYGAGGFFVYKGVF
jgi:Tfp pilus assembly protein PilF